MKELFKKLTTTNYEPHTNKYTKELQNLLADVGVKCYSDLLYNTPQLRKNSRVSKKKQEEEENIKGKIKQVKYYCINWKFQLFWSRLQYVCPRDINENKNSYCM